MTTSDLTAMEKQAQYLKSGGNCADALQLRLALERLYDQDGGAIADQSRNLNYIAFIAILLGDAFEAERAARKCVQLYRSSPSDYEELATYVMMLSSVLAEGRRFDEAAGYGEEALQLFSRLFGETNSFVQARKADVEDMRHQTIRPYIDR